MKKVLKLLFILSFIFILSSCNKTSGKESETINNKDLVNSTQTTQSTETTKDTKNVSTFESGEVKISNIDYRIVDYDNYVKNKIENKIDLFSNENKYSTIKDKIYLIIEFNLVGNDIDENDFVEYTFTLNYSIADLNIEETDTANIDINDEFVTLNFSYGVSEINKTERIDASIIITGNSEINFLINDENILSVPFTNFDYELEYFSNVNELVVAKYKGNEKDLEIPSTICGVNITSIEPQCFKDCSTLNSIIISDNIVSIGYSAFENCSSLTSITIGNGVSWIGNNAFSGCSSLLSVVIPSSVESIGEGALGDCTSLESITIPFVGETTESNYFLGYIFGMSSYKYNSYIPSSLKTVIITGKCTSIYNNTFNGCSSLESITIPSTVAIIGSYAFYNCVSLTNINYTGTEEEWNAIDKGNNDFSSITINYNYNEN